MHKKCQFFKILNNLNSFEDELSFETSLHYMVCYLIDINVNFLKGALEPVYSYHISSNLNVSNNFMKKKMERMKLSK